MKLELMNEEEQAKAFDTLCEVYPEFTPHWAARPKSEESKARGYRWYRGNADAEGFCCVSYMLESEG